MKKPVLIFLHIGYWCLYWFLFTFLYFVSRASSQTIFNDDWVTIMGLASLTGFSSFYAFYSWLVPVYLTKRRILAFTVFGLAVSVVTGFLTTLVISITVYSLASIFPEIEGQTTLIGIFTILALVNGLLGTIIRGFITWFVEIRMKESLKNRNLQIELALLKAQINPHFLFNTLNNIDVLIEHDAKRASLYLNKLSDLLRFVLYETQADRIPLTDELAYIRKYVDLQKIRTTNPHFVDLRITGQPESLTIAPMIFIPYIENAFKHATNKKVTNAIKIQIMIDNSVVRFRCVNVIDSGKTTVQPYGGLGNQLLRQRLELLYPKQHTLAIQTTADEYTVDLSVEPATHELSYR